MRSPVTRNPAMPNGSLSVNAQPWAEVVLDGTVIGETPIANFMHKRVVSVELDAEQDEIAQTVGSLDEVEDEIRYLLSFL